MPLVTAAFRALGALFAFCWLFCAAFNAAVAWRVHMRRIARGPSAAPLVGGICAALAWLLWTIPRHPGSGSGPASLPWLGLALLLDYGTIPVHALWALRMARNTLRRGRESL